MNMGSVTAKKELAQKRKERADADQHEENASANQPTSVLIDLRREN